MGEASSQGAAGGSPEEVMSEQEFQLVEGRRRHFTWVGVCEGLNQAAGP